MSFYLYLYWSCTISLETVETTAMYWQLDDIVRLRTLQIEAPIGCWSLLGTRLPSSQLWSWQQPTWQQFPSTTLQLHRFVIELAGQVQRVPSSWFWENSGAPFSADLVVSFCIHTWYLSFFLHEQNFWRIKFTPLNP